jgi:hypothetical protein
MTDREHPVLRLGCSDHLVGLDERRGNGLFNHDMAAGGERLHDSSVVILGRDRNGDGLWFLFLQQLPEGGIASCGVEGCDLTRGVQVRVGDPDQFHIAHLTKDAGMVASHHPRPDNAHAGHSELTAAAMRSRSDWSNRGCTGKDKTDSATRSVTARSMSPISA